MLSIIPIILCFLETALPDNVLAENVRCFTLLWMIVGLCSMGADDATHYVELLRRLIGEHAKLFANLYPTAVTPKFHHLLHIPDNVIFLGKLLSCFVTERKHRFTKRAALFVFRHVDNTVLNTIVTNQCEAMKGNKGSLFSEVFLVPPIKRVCINGIEFLEAVQAALPCGAVRRGDIVSLKTGDIGEVDHFWSNSDQTNIVVRLMVFHADPEDPTSLDVSMPTTKVVDIDEILDGVMWANRGDHRIRIILPFRARFADILAHNRA
jgi:hypothetical protein